MKAFLLSLGNNSRRRGRSGTVVGHGGNVHPRDNDMRDGNERRTQIEWCTAMATPLRWGTGWEGSAILPVTQAHWQLIKNTTLGL